MTARSCSLRPPWSCPEPRNYAPPSRRRRRNPRKDRVSSRYCRYFKAAPLDDGAVKLELEELAANNIRHYGILNIISLASYMPTLVATVGTVVTKLRTLQGGDRSAHLVLAAGIWNYNETSAWVTYQGQFGVLASLDVDIVTSISSVRTMRLHERCQVAPPTVWKTTSAAYPGFDKHATLLLNSTTYPRPDLYVGLSFEMGVMLYQLKDPSTPRERVPYAPCTDFALVGYEQVDSVMRLPVRKKIAWLLFDTHLSDVTWDCTAAKEREKALKKHIASFG